MNRPVLIVGTLLTVFGLGVFGYKHLALGLHLVPSNPEGVWQVEVQITARGDGRGTVRAALPSNANHQVVFDETSSSDRLSLAIDQEGPGRVGIWNGRLEGIHRIAYSFRARLRGATYELPPAPAERKVPERIATAYLPSTSDFPTESAEVQAALEELAMPPEDDPSGRLRTVFAFVEHRIATVGNGPSDALLTLAEREGNRVGKTKLLVTLLRAAGLPARMVSGLQLAERSDPDIEHWAEVWVADEWVPVEATGDFFAERPNDQLALRYGPGDLVESVNVQALDSQFSALKERLGPQELANMMIPENELFASLSLYKLPLRTQKALRLLLLLPLGALVVSIFRNFIGLRTFGTFMPILMGLALRETSLLIGIAMLGIVMTLGVATRRLLEGLRLLVVPRISFLLCVTILCVVGLALAGEGLGTRDFFAGVVFPIIVLTMVIERFSLVMAEEGVTEALRRTGHSMLIAVAVYPLFRSTRAEHLMFGFPELVLVVMGLLVFIGGYMGFRLTDFMRFRLLTKSAPAEAMPMELFEQKQQAAEEKQRAAGDHPA